MHEHWQNKRRRSPGMATERIDHLYTLARRSGVSRREARRRRRRRVPARVRPAARRHAAGDGGGGRAGAARSTSSSRAARAPSTHDARRPVGALSVGIVGCGLIGTQARRRARAATSSSRRFDVDAGRCELARRRVRRDGVPGRSTSCSRMSADVVIVAVTHDRLAETACTALGAGAHVLVEKPAGIGSSDVGRIAGSGRSRRPAGQGRVQPSLPPGDRARGRRGAIRAVRADPARARALRARRAPRLRPRVAGATARVSGGGELVDQGMHLLDLSYWLLGPLPLALGAAAHGTSGR